MTRLKVDVKVKWLELFSKVIDLKMSAILLALLIVCGLVWWSYTLETGWGESVDMVHSMEYSGIVCKTWKVWLVNDHPTSGENAQDAVYSISKENEDSTIQTLKTALAQKKKAHIEYHTKLYTISCLDSLHSGYAIIDKAELSEQ